MKEPETGKKENTGKSGYSITTWRLHLWCRHPEWLRTTQEFYNRIAEFYYNLLLDHTDLWELGSQQTLRELEIMSIPGRGGRIPSDPLPWQKVPLYFRRAAANEGIASAKSYISRFAQDEKIGRAEKLNAAVTYYKGMYQDFSAKEITLRGEIYKRSEFCSYKEIKFEGRNCLIPSNYDAYLKRRYGEYMTPPDMDHHDRNCYLVYNLGKYKKEI